MAENVETFIAFTGAPADQAAIFLEMAGGNVETAVEIYLSSQDGGGGDVAMADVPAAEAPAAGGCEVPPWWNTIWPAREAPPEAWLLQRLDSGTDGGWKGGIPQPKNGPCGVLAVVHGLVLAEQHSRGTAEVEVSAEAVAKVITDIILRCRPEEGAVVRLCRPEQKGQYGPEAELEVTEFDAASATAEISARIADFQGPGGVIDLVYSAVFTRGMDLVQQEALSEGGELPLVPKAFNCWLCSMELMSLLLRGRAQGNVGAFHADGSQNTCWEGFNTVGILSRKEKEQGIPIADALKSPKSPVWILHGGDHFTCAWAQSAPSAEAGAKFTLHHWNGLPPGGPRLAELAMTAVKGAVAGGLQAAPKFYKPEPGEIDEVVQADPEDKKSSPGQYRKWRYEVMLAWDRPDLQGEPRPEGEPPEPKYDQEDPRYQRDGPWRCRLCYDRRFQTMDFSLVPAESPDACPKCAKPRKECGWSLWVPFPELPPKRQESIVAPGNGDGPACQENRAYPLDQMATG